ncbi:DMT family transporter [Mesobacillus foraminis]|uniref:Small multidrug resistance pump n=1 Tax=Mesobacillus foraminis TaxID=279826 RepID=A0A4R2B6K4_9BACI|nr:multidrug efflux SMR transporter [Mesobacillus foraminis]TCN22338.1 small multidrug resistance pump [Mesobacillus foraminis]
MAYVFLLLSIMGELIGTSLLKASDGFTKVFPTIGVIISFVFAFFFLSLSLKTIPLNIAYALWSGIGTVATVVISILIWKEKITAGSVIGILLIVAGVVVLNFFGPSGAHAQDSEEAQYQISRDPK